MSTAVDAPARLSLSGPLRAALWSAFLFRAGQSAAGVLVGLTLAGLSTRGAGPTAATVGALLSVNYVTELLTAPAFGALSDRFGRKLLIVGGPILGFLAIQVYPTTSAVALLFLARALEGVAAGSLTPASLGFLSDETTATVARRGRTMAFFEIATLLGIGVGYALGGVLYQALDLNGFRLASAFYLMAAVVAAVWLPRHPRMASGPHASLADYVRAATRPAIVRLAPAWLAITAVLGVWFANTVYQLSGPTRPGQALMGGFSGNTVSAILGGFVLTLIAGTYTWGRLFSRFRKKTTMMLVALCGTTVVCADLLIVNHRDGASTVWLWLLLPVLALAVATESGFTPAVLAFLADVTEDLVAERGAIMGLYSFFLGVGEVIGGVAGGRFAQAWGLDGLIFLTIILAAIAFAGVLITRPFEKSRGSFGADRGG